LNNGAKGAVSGLKMTATRVTPGDLFEQLDPFSHHRRVVGAEPRNVAARSREALNKAQPDGIRDEHENDRYRARLLPQRCERRRGAR
jgi:hypothetical protein